MSLITLNGSTIEGANDNEKWSTAYSAAQNGNTIGAQAAEITGQSATTKKLIYKFDGTVFSDGGLMSLNVSGSTISGSTFSRNCNTASDNGGAIYTNGVTSTIANTLFAGNTAKQGGGAYIYYKSAVQISGSTFSGNVATSGTGGALYVGSGTMVTISDSQFLTATDTIAIGGTVSFSGANTLNASINSWGTLLATENSSLRRFVKKYAQIPSLTRLVGKSKILSRMYSSSRKPYA